MNKFLEIVFDLPLANSFTYEIDSEEELFGKRVSVDFRNRKSEGIVIHESHNIPDFKTKKIIKIIDKESVINHDQINLAKWMAENYLSTIGESIYKMIPKGKKIKNLSVHDLKIENLSILSNQQNIIFEKMKLNLNKFGVHLLHGITGSGKTEIYIHLMKDVLLHSKKSIIFLVPEIGISVQIIKRLELVFPNQVALIHSSLKKSEKFNSYLDILKNQKRILVGTRSAIFAPIESIGLIIIDEEHDASYKEHSSPRYNAKQIAIKRAKDHNAFVVLGSATPSIEMYYNAKIGKIGFNYLENRPAESILPRVEIITRKNKNEYFSSRLLFKIKEKLELKEQVILLLNRRGHSPMVYSAVEKKYVECPNCSSTLCFHKGGFIQCHLCGFKQFLRELEKIKKEKLELSGSGTQKIEENLIELFPGKNIERLDLDSMKNKEILSDVIERMIAGEIDIITGTQMITKGFDIENVTLVGVLDADVGLGLPDFRMNERIFSMLVQVSGRAGRSKKTGEVLIQTFNPSSQVIQFAVHHDYVGFFHNEIQNRKKYFYPPFCRLIRLLSRSKDEKQGSELIEKIYTIVKRGQIDDIESSILGPSSCPFAKIDNNFRNHIIIKSTKIQYWREYLKNNLPKNSNDKKSYLEIDFDPMDLL